MQAPKLNQKSIAYALAHGHSFIAFEARGIAEKFSFLAKTKEGSLGIGAHPLFKPPIMLSVKVPQAAEIHLISNGEIVRKVKEVSRLDFYARTPGAYRVEVYRKGKIWIVSNPIYVEA